MGGSGSGGGSGTTQLSAYACECASSVTTSIAEVTQITT